MSDSRDEWHVRDRVLYPGRAALVMGIVNVTPDSFSDGGKFFDTNAAVSHDGRTTYFTAGRTLYAYDAAYRVLRGPYDAGAPIGGLAFSRDDRRLVVVRRDGRVRQLNAATGKTIG